MPNNSNQTDEICEKSTGGITKRSREREKAQVDMRKRILNLFAYVHLPARAGAKNGSSASLEKTRSAKEHC